METLLLAGISFYNHVKEAARERENPLAGSEPGMLNSPALSACVVFCRVLSAGTLHRLENAVRYNVWQHDGLYICGACPRAPFAR